MTGLDDVLDAVLATGRDRPEVLAAAVLALLVVGWTASWRVARGVVTIAHEGGHALVAVLAGRGLTGIRLHADTSGVTTSPGRAGGLGLVLTFLAGYPAPAVLGMVGALLVATDRAAASLWLVVVLLVATLLQVRNAYGVVSVLVTGAVVGAVAWWGDATLQARFAAAMAWFLLFGGAALGARTAAWPSARGSALRRRVGRRRARAAHRRARRNVGGPVLVRCGSGRDHGRMGAGERNRVTELDGVNDWNKQIIAEFRANGGKVGGPFEGATMLLLHHVGARSGTERVTPLVYFPDGDRMVIVASAAGAPKNPDWYHNIKASPRVEVEVGTDTVAVEAQELAGVERDEKWAEITAAAPGFAEYQTKTSRVIPVIALKRVA